MFDEARITTLDLVTRCALGLAALVCLFVCRTSALSLDMTGTFGPLVALFAMAAVAIAYGPRRRNAPRLSVAATLAADLITYSLVLGTFSYVAAASPRPLIHPSLAAIDRSLGFDWLAYYHFIESRPRVAGLLSLAYDGMIVEIGLVALVLYVTRADSELRILLNAFALAALVIISLSALFPALEALSYFGIYPLIETSQGPVTGIDRADDFLAMHFGRMTAVPIVAAKGIVCFPSFHTACGVIAALCAYPIRWLRLPILAWSFLLIMATPVDGGHYLIDVIVGFIIATGLVAFILAYTRRVSPSPSLVLVASEPTSRV
jgi:membrane-associated phospholipid phosphatase